MLIRGEPGIGKSALLQYARQLAEGITVLSATAAEAEADMAYAALQNLLQPVIGRLGRVPKVQQQALYQALGLADGEAPDRFLVSLATLSLLSEVAIEEPVLCILDDAHWADRATLDVLAFTARRVSAEPLAILIAMRPEEGEAIEPVGMQEMTLSGLRPEAAAAFLDELWGDQLAQAVRARLVQLTTGNPLALIELPRTLTKEQLAGREPLFEPVPMTGRLEAIFEKAIQKLGTEQRRLVVLCAAEGSGSLAIIARAAEVLGVDDPIQKLGQIRKLLEVGDLWVAFRHPLMRSTAYQTASASDRQLSHLALADALDGDPSNADRKAWHRAHAVIGTSNEIATELEATADRALRRSGHAAAPAALERAAELSTSDVAKARRLVAAADAAWRGGDGTRARGLLARSQDLDASEIDTRLQSGLLRGLMALRSAAPADAVAMLLGSANEALGVRPELAFAALCAASEAAFRALDTHAHREIVRLMSMLPPSDDPARSLLQGLHQSVNRMALGEEPKPNLDGFALVEQLDDPYLLGRAGGLAFGVGEYALARRLRSKAVARARALGAAGELAWALRGLALDELTRGRYAWADAYASEGIHLSLETGQPSLSCEHKAILAEVAALRGKEEVARQLIDGVLDEATSCGLLSTSILVRRSLIELAMAAGNVDEALQRLQLLGKVPGAAAFAFYCIPDLVEASVRAGHAESCGDSVARYVSWAQISGAREAMALAMRVRALVAIDGEAENLYWKALELHSGTERPMETARTALLFGEHLRRERRRADAREPLRMALETFEALGSTIWASRARNELRATGETARKRRSSTLECLTPQELQVVKLVSEGATNREAAAQLFISPRTVDHHLRGVFRKLGVKSRAQLVRLAVASQ